MASFYVLWSTRFREEGVVELGPGRRRGLVLRVTKGLTGREGRENLGLGCIRTLTCVDSRLLRLTESNGAMMRLVRLKAGVLAGSSMVSNITSVVNRIRMRTAFPSKAGLIAMRGPVRWKKR